MVDRTKDLRRQALRNADALEQSWDTLRDYLEVQAAKIESGFDTLEARHMRDLVSAVRVDVTDLVSDVTSVVRALEDAEDSLIDYADDMARMERRLEELED